MTTISSNTLATKLLKTKKSRIAKKSIWDKYLDYADSKSKEGIIWYLKTIILIPCIFMVFSIIAMAEITPNYVWFVGVTIMLFYANVIAHIAQTKSRFYIPLYHATIATMILIPLITFLIK